MEKYQIVGAVLLGVLTGLVAIVMTLAILKLAEAITILCDIEWRWIKSTKKPYIRGIIMLIIAVILGLVLSEIFF